MTPHPLRRRQVAVAAAVALGLVAASLSAASPAWAADTVLAPVSMTSTTGSTGSGQTVANLKVKDQSGTADAYAKYVEFVKTSSGYSGYRDYTVPSSIPRSSVTGITVKANYRGETSASQTWTWSLYNWSTAAWTAVGTNAGAASWVWKDLSFASPSSAASYVSSTGTVRVRLATTGKVDNAQLDYESVTVTSGATAADTTAPSAPTGLTSPSKTSSSVALSWTASTDNVGVTGYDIYQGTTKVASTTTTSATVTGLAANTAYSFTVKATDAAGNVSAASGALSVTTSTATTTPTTGVVLPPQNGKWDYQIGGAYTPPSGVVVVSRDRLASPVAGLYNICYVNVMQTQPDEPGQSTTNPPYGTTAWWLKNHPNVVLKDASGKPIVDAKWNEVVFDVRTAAQRDELASVQKPWLQACKDAGFQAIEPDNLDAEVRSSGYLTHADVRKYLEILVPYAHSIGLAIGQKNATSSDVGPEWETDGPSFVTVNGVKQGFDFAIAEECGAYGECGTFNTMYPGRVYVVEYTDAGFTKGCSAWSSTLSVIRRGENVLPPGNAEYAYREC